MVRAKQRAETAMRDVMIENLQIGLDHPPVIIAEMSGNHNGSLNRALEIVDMAARAGAHMLKIQTYTADTMTIPHDEGLFFIDDENSLWHGKSLHDLYQQAYTPWDWHEAIFDRAKQHGMIGFSAPFDSSAVDFLETLNVPCYKIASFENIDLPLIAKTAATGKPMIISTGMASLGEIDEAVQCARDNGCSDLILLKCTSTYPANVEDSNLSAIPVLQKSFDCPVGLSDHTLGIGAAIASVAIGGVVIEKHVTLKRSDGGVDSAFSLEPNELSDLVTQSRVAKAALGRPNFGPSEAELGSLRFRRSIYIVETVKKGDIISSDNVRIIRPGGGLQPKFLDNILGKKFSSDFDIGTPFDWSMID